ncbi:MAG: bifunctional diaminohydroxyphosphoribosylaminopyrimidine deaminase/5-amino-6-(5-phosphoribosylamino)uracil reductase RibD [Candidatus Sericytochromatia bacterium]|nr:bifunctional diaminohydroxyphosphoribosylaminopyrimidine deaminase/5-amino-6-(5-phosphoribosylamino)uracil reductase RibD [Candidatus Sericytochromatia bacterium]
MSSATESEGRGLGASVADAMQRALQLAELGRGWTSPSPLAGAVVLLDGVPLAEGFTQDAGGRHAIFHALAAAGDAARGATLVLTTEPGGTPGQVVEAVLGARIARVVMAAPDPNPASRGQVRDALIQAGVKVEDGPFTEAAARLNEAHEVFLRTRRPFVTVFSVMSVDGKTATSIGERPPAPASLLDDLRAEHDAVLLGVQDLVAEDVLPETTRSRGRSPLCVVIDGMARLPLGARILSRPQIAGQRSSTLLVTSRYAPKDRVASLREAGAEILEVPTTGDPLAVNIDLDRLLMLLGRRNVASVLVEAGGTLADAAFEAGLVDRLVLFLHPSLLGGAASPSLVGGLGHAFVESAPRLEGLEARVTGEGLVVTGRVVSAP